MWMRWIIVVLRVSGIQLPSGYAWARNHQADQACIIMPNATCA
jgi:hypothetical protein